MRRAWTHVAVIFSTLTLAGLALADSPAVDLTKPTLYEVGYAHLDTSTFAYYRL